MATVRIVVSELETDARLTVLNPCFTNRGQHLVGVLAVRLGILSSNDLMPTREIAVW